MTADASPILYSVHSTRHPSETNGFYLRQRAMGGGFAFEEALSLEPGDASAWEAHVALALAALFGGEVVVSARRCEVTLPLLQTPRPLKLPMTPGESVTGQAIEAVCEARKEPLLRYFRHAHLPPALAEISKPFRGLAEHILTLPAGPERTVALRKLLESKDCAVRASLPEDDA